MRECKECNIILEDDVRFCPNCGANVAGDQPAGGGSSSNQVSALITSAGLHRLNGEWEAALADANEALKLDPNNGDVASLLASIYEQRGNIDEAAVWYRIATEMNPGNAADRANLQRVTDLSSIRPARRALQHHTSADKRKWIIPAAIGGAMLLVILILILALAIGKQKPGSTRLPNSSNSETKAPPITSVTTPSSGRATESQDQQSSQAPLAGGTVSTARTPAEVAIRGGLQQSEAVQRSRARIDDVIADPRQSIVIATFSMPGGVSVTKLSVIDSALAVARGVFGSNSEAKYVTARGIITTDNASSTQIAFVGDIARSAIESLPDNPTQEQLQSAFNNVWWNPQLR